MNDETRALTIQFDHPLTHCPICGSSAICLWKRKLNDSTEYSIFTCNDCTGGFLNPRPSNETLERIYSLSGHGLSQEVTCDDILNQEEEFPNSSVDAERMISISKNLFPSHRTDEFGGQHTLIDIGSGFGFYSLCGVKHGFDVVSVNPGTYENRVFNEMFLRNGLTANIHVGMFEHFCFDKETFAVAIASQILEHIKNPRAIVLKIDEILMPGGVLAIAVPNFHSFFVRLLGINEHSCLWVPEHCNYFTQRSLQSLISGSTLKLSKIIHVAKIPYYAMSERLSLEKGTIARRLVNGFVKTAQYIPCRTMEFFGIGNYLNAFFVKEG
ncbi:MAG: methyltransferase domain-containing protein [Desulfosarcina sp.]|nr:methyltransferase domain-containing protein [Desulfosarcina sp.]